MRITLAVLVLILVAMPAARATSGHGGNGGNGCWWPRERLFYAVEEMHYLRAEPDLSLAPARFGTGPQLGPALLRDNAPVVAEARRRLGLLALRFPGVAGEVEDMLAVVQTGMVARDVVVDGHYGAGHWARDMCVLGELRPGVLAFPNGGVVFVDRMWQLASARTQVVLLMHEAIRLLQMHHPAFAGMPHARLELLAALAYDGRYHLTDWYERYEEALSGFVPPAQGETFRQALSRGDLQGALQARIREALLAGQAAGEGMAAAMADGAFRRAQRGQLCGALRLNCR